MGVPPNHPLVLTPMVTWGSPILGNLCMLLVTLWETKITMENHNV